MNVLKAENLRKTYGSGETQVKALNDISLEVETGEFVAIVGTSGSGKSTLLHMLGGLDQVDTGDIYIGGKNIKELNDEELTIFRRRNIGFIFQQYNLVPMLTVRENIVLPIRMDGKKVDEQFFQDVIHTLGIEEKMDAFPGMLSGGQQQRVAIARALVLKPEI